MKELEMFVGQSKGSSDASCIITTNQNGSLVEGQLLIKGFSVVNNKVDFFISTEEGKNIFIPLYRLENFEDWYKIFVDYSSGQLYDDEINKRVNPNYKENNIIVILDEKTINKFNINILGVLGLTLQIK